MVGMLYAAFLLATYAGCAVMMYRIVYQLADPSNTPIYDIVSVVAH